MGCDIHLYVEARENGKWAHKNVIGYNGREYNLFSVLANVRNRHDLTPICEPKGLPTGMSSEVANKMESGVYAYHSHSWLTLSEIQSFDWTKTATLSGVVNGPEYLHWISYNKTVGKGPDYYCQGAGGPNIQHITEQEMESIINSAMKQSEGVRSCADKYKSHYCRVSWNVPYWEFASHFIGTLVPQLWVLGSPEDVRIVFCFDN